MTRILPETLQKIKLTVDPELVLTYLGFRIVRKNPKELRGPCKVHGGDNPTGFRFNLETRTWCCYTRRCEANGDRDLIGLVQRVQEVSFIDAVKFLANLAGIDLENQDVISEDYIKLRESLEIKKEINRQKNKLVQEKFFPEEEIELYIPNRSDYFIKRGFPSQLLDFFQVGGKKDKYGIHRETIPIRDPEGNLLTLSMRRTDSDEDPKYILAKNISKSATLYNLDLAKHYTGLPRTLILVEGFVDVWRLTLNGVWNVVAAMGADISPPQARLLSQYADEVLILLDPDEAGREGSKRVKEMLKFYVGAHIIENDKDPKYFEFSDIKKLFGGFIYYE